MSNTYSIVPAAIHNQLIEAAYRHRGYTEAEARDAARFCALATTHGIRTHNAIKALHLDEHFGSKVGIDATKKWPTEGFTREWPERQTMDPRVVERVKARWSELGL